MSINQIDAKLQHQSRLLDVCSSIDEKLLSADDDFFEFLKIKPHLINILSQQLELTASVFKNDRLHLTILRDRENSALNKLSIVVNTGLDVSTVLTALQELDDLCSEAHIPSDILVHVEFS
jgi:hypothetical protein